MMRAHLAAGACILMLLTACSDSDSSSSDEVRSGSGPTPAESTAAESSDSATDTATTATTTATTTAPLLTSPSLLVKGKVEVPDGTDGQLSIVEIGPPDNDSGSVPVLIRNRTAAALSNLEVTGTARGTDGALIASGSSQGFTPSLVNPGEWAFGYVYFDAPKLSAETQFDLTATGQEPDDFLDSVDVPIVEVNLTKSDFGQQFVGIVENPSTTDEVGGPISVDVACFDDRGKLMATVGGYTDADPLPAGGTSGFSVDLFDDACPNYAIGSSGYTF